MDDYNQKNEDQQNVENQEQKSTVESGTNDPSTQLSNDEDESKKNSENTDNGESTENGKENNENSESKTSEQKNEEGKIFVGGLNIETTDENLRNYFSQYGELTDCVVMRTDNGMSRCFGFLTFKDPSVIDEILKKKHNLDGKDIDPKRAIPREEQEKTEKIFVGGVKPEVTEEEFKEYFSQFGNVVEATLMSNKDTGRPRGFGFITFDNDQSVEAVLAKQGEIIIKDKPVEVKRALPKSKTAKLNYMSRRNNYMMDQRRSYAGPIRNSRMGGDPRYMRGGYGMMGYGRDYGNRGNRGGYYGYGGGNGYGYNGYDNMNMYYRGHGGSGQQNYSYGYNARYQYNNNGGQGYGYGSRTGDSTNNYGYNSGYGNSRVNNMNGGYSGNAPNQVQGQQSQSRSSHGYHPYAH
jgi:heterogeneous nuclear ribonucleoprotein A1/A3